MWVPSWRDAVAQGVGGVDNKNQKFDSKEQHCLLQSRMIVTGALSLLLLLSYQKFI